MWIKRNHAHRQHQRTLHAISYQPPQYTLKTLNQRQDESTATICIISKSVTWAESTGTYLPIGHRQLHSSINGFRCKIIAWFWSRDPRSYLRWKVMVVSEPLLSCQIFRRAVARHGEKAGSMVTHDAFTFICQHHHVSSCISESLLHFWTTASRQYKPTVAHLISLSFLFRACIGWKG